MLNRPNYNTEGNNEDPNSKFYNKFWYHPEYDDYETHNDNIALYTRDVPDELDFEDVWDGAWNNIMMPEYFYFAFFCGAIYTFEPEVIIFFIR
jgi:hypothetical protein